ncbi:MAG TPA: hypothetical protein VGU03_09395 [Frateuria sp.]|uniref:hypothetical protein n=1 Tax=Frateuria sp. TaxID=2211372 RepID=UPI002DE9C41D|nr:hypothetical protein [Frateuria sp.]
MNNKTRTIWFPAKRYGWGWGLPITWQGWLVLLVCLGIVAAAVHFVPPDRDPLAFALAIGAAVVAQSVAFWLKGERPRWRWGDD